MSIEEQLSSIENEIFNTTKQKIDSYTLAVIRANLMANEPLVHTYKKLDDKINLFFVIALLLLIFSIFAHAIIHFDSSPNIEEELVKLKTVVAYDDEKNEYFIKADDYKIIKEKDRKGIVLILDAK